MMKNSNANAMQKILQRKTHAENKKSSAKYGTVLVSTGGQWPVASPIPFYFLLLYGSYRYSPRYCTGDGTRQTPTERVSNYYLRRIVLRSE